MGAIPGCEMLEPALSDLERLRAKRGGGERESNLSACSRFDPEFTEGPKGNGMMGVVLNL